MEKLEHKFGDDGLFWMAYTDLLQRFNLLDRTRLFDQEWYESMRYGVFVERELMIRMVF
jgi:hypothetical protein